MTVDISDPLPVHDMPDWWISKRPGDLPHISTFKPRNEDYVAGPFDDPYEAEAWLVRSRRARAATIAITAIACAIACGLGVLGGYWVSA